MTRKLLISVGKRFRHRVTRKGRDPCCWIRKRVYQLRSRPTAAESEFMRKLDEIGFDYIFQAGWRGPAGMFAIFDFVLPKHRLIIEIDGGYHTPEEQALKDAGRDWFTNKVLEVGVLRICNQEALTMSAEHVRRRIGDCQRRSRRHDFMAYLIT